MGNRWAVYGYQWDDYSGWYYETLFEGESYDSAFDRFVWATYEFSHAKIEFRG